MTWRMNFWMAMKAALTVMDLVTREWARQLEVDECGVMVLMQLGYRQSSSAAKLGFFCGRVRQQVQRSLQLLRKAGLVEPATVSGTGCTTAWTLTQKGKTRARALERAVRAWEEELGRVIEVPQLTESLVRVAEAAVNRPGANGWRRGLLIPHELKKVPLWFEVSMQEELLDSEPTPSSPDEASAERERARVQREWDAMWMRINS